MNGESLLGQISLCTQQLIEYTLSCLIRVEEPPSVDLHHAKGLPLIHGRLCFCFGVCLCRGERAMEREKGEKIIQLGDYHTKNGGRVEIGNEPLELALL